MDFLVKSLHGISRCSIYCVIFIHQHDNPLNLLSASSNGNNQLSQLFQVSSHVQITTNVIQVEDKVSKRSVLE